MPEPTPVVVDHAEAARFEHRVGDAVAGYAEYRLLPGTIAFTHTVVEPAFAGQGIGSALARGSLDLARERGLAVLPFCPFIRAWIERHPDYADLVPATRRAGFGLPPQAPG